MSLGRVRGPNEGIGPRLHVLFLSSFAPPLLLLCSISAPSLLLLGSFSCPSLLLLCSFSAPPLLLLRSFSTPSLLLLLSFSAPSLNFPCSFSAPFPVALTVVFVLDSNLLTDVRNVNNIANKSTLNGHAWQSTRTLYNRPMS